MTTDHGPRINTEKQYWSVIAVLDEELEVSVPPFPLLPPCKLTSSYLCVRSLSRYIGVVKKNEGWYTTTALRHKERRNSMIVAEEMECLVI